MEDLLLQLESPDAGARRSAARDLGQFADVSDVLWRRLGGEPSTAVRGMIFSSLARIGNADAVEGLVALLRSEDAELRNGAIDVLKCLPDQVGRHIGALLADADPDVRIFAINIMVSLAHRGIPDWLLAVVERDPDVNVCATALDLLTERGTPDMIPAIEASAKRFPKVPYIRFAVDMAVGRIGGADQPGAERGAL
jgi:HEAT repeat protein